MTVLTIDITGDTADRSVRLKLDGVTVRLRFQFNNVADRWTMTVYNADDVAIVAGVLVRSDALLLEAFPNRLDLPRGLLGTIDTAGVGRDPDFDALGTTVLLMYGEAAAG